MIQMINLVRWRVFGGQAGATAMACVAGDAGGVPPVPSPLGRADGEEPPRVLGGAASPAPPPGLQ